MINNQPPESPNIDQELLAVHSIFYTIQGEGPYTGRPAVFIRLAGCNLQCPGCDTDYTSNRKLMSVSSVIKYTKQLIPKRLRLPGFLVVVTGGEPFRQHIAPLVEELTLNERLNVQIETNGTLFSGGNEDYFTQPNIDRTRVMIICSPKTGQINRRLMPFINAYKYVVSHEQMSADGLPLLALNHPASPCLARPSAVYRAPVYLQPMDSGDEAINKLNIEACLWSCMTFGYIMQLQIHKLIGVQ